jgi:hypothetical protein
MEAIRRQGFQYPAERRRSVTIRRMQETLWVRRDKLAVQKILELSPQLPTPLNDSSLLIFLHVVDVRQVFQAPPDLLVPPPERVGIPSTKSPPRVLSAVVLCGPISVCRGKKACFFTSTCSRNPYLIFTCSQSGPSQLGSQGLRIGWRFRTTWRASPKIRAGWSSSWTSFRI